MAVGSRLILPGIAPVGAGANDSQRRVGDGGFTAGGLEQDTAIVSGAQPAQSELGRGEVIDASLKIGEVAANQVELDLVERSRASRGAKIDFAARIFSLPGDACGKVQELGHCLEIRRGIGLDGGPGGDAASDCRKGSDSSLAHLGWHARWLKRGIDLERQGLVAKVQEMRVGANARVGMLGSFVVVPALFGVDVAGHSW